MASTTATDFLRDAFQREYSVTVDGDTGGMWCGMPHYLNLRLSRDQYSKWDPQKTKLDQIPIDMHKGPT